MSCIQLVKVPISTEYEPDLYKLDSVFTQFFQLAVERYILINAFLNDEDGQYIVGEQEEMARVFGKKYPLIKFDFEKYIETVDHDFWMGICNPPDYKPTLCRMTKNSKLEQYNKKE